METFYDFNNRFDEYIKFKTRYMARDASEADELRQKASIVLWRNFDRLVDMNEQTVKSFLSKSIKNSLIDLRRREKKVQPFYEPLLQIQTKTPFDHGFENEVIDKMSVMSVIYKLSDLEQDIIFKTYYMGMDSVEIGKELNLSPSTVRSKRMRANQKLKKFLQEKE